MTKSKVTVGRKLDYPEHAQPQTRERSRQSEANPTDSDCPKVTALQSRHTVLATPPQIALYVLLVLLLNYSTQRCLSDSYPFAWAKKAGGKTIDQAGGIGVDNAGNCYVTGTFTGTATFDTVSLTSSGGGDVFVAKYNSEGVLQWIRQAGGPGNDEGHAIAVDAVGGVYVTGFFTETALFGPFSIKSAGGALAFVAKFNNEGDVVWVMKVGGPGQAMTNAIAVDRLGNSFVTGYFYDRFEVGPYFITDGGGGPDVFVAKLDPQGRIEWGKSAGGTGLEMGRAIGVDSAGNCYVTGFFNDAPAVFSGLTLTNSGSFDVFLAKYDSAGRIQWARRAGAKGGDDAWGIAVATNGDSYVTGRFEGTVDLGGITLISKGGISAFIVKYRSDGQALWAREIGPGQNIGTGIALDQTEACYITGDLWGGHFDSVALTSEPGIFLAKYDSAGNLKWAQAAGHADYGAPRLAVNESGTSYLTGGFSSPATFGDVTLQANDFDIWVAKRANKVPPVVRKHPESRTVVSGMDATLAVDAAGPVPLSFQWTKDGRVLNGQTNGTLILKQVRAQDAGNYAVTISNSDGTVTSLPAALDVRDIVVLINGSIFTDSQYVSEGPVQVSIQSGFKNGLVFYSLGDTPASFASKEYSAPFKLDRTTVVHAIVYSEDFLQIREIEPVRIVILQSFVLMAQTPRGGQININPKKSIYVENSLVTLTAIPQEGWAFVGWRGDAFDTNQTITVLMDRNKAFEGIFGTRLTTTTAGAGSIFVNPSASTYPFGSTIQLSAVPESGYQLALWGNSAQGFVNPLVLKITITTPAVSCLFAPLPAGQFSLTVVPVGSGTVSINPQSRSYGAGDKVTIIALPDQKQDFIGWTGSVNTNQNPLMITISNSVTLSARFTQRARLSIRRDKEAITIGLSGTIGSQYRIEGSENLMNWISLGNSQAPTGVGIFTDLTGLNLSSRFYRAVSIEP